MEKCYICGNYKNMPTISYEKDTHFFDSYECLVEKTEPNCDYCQCKFIRREEKNRGRYDFCACCENK